MEPLDDFEHQLLLSGFSLASYALKHLGRAGLVDDETRALIRAHLELLTAKVDALPESQQAGVQRYVDMLTAVLPPPTSGDGSQASE